MTWNFDASTLTMVDTHLPSGGLRRKARRQRVRGADVSTLVAGHSSWENMFSSFMSTRFCFLYWVGFIEEFWYRKVVKRHKSLKVLVEEFLMWTRICTNIYEGFILWRSFRLQNLVQQAIVSFSTSNFYDQMISWFRCRVLLTLALSSWEPKGTPQCHPPKK